MFLGKAWSLPLRGAPQGAHKHRTKLERHVRDKDSSLLYPFVNYEENSAVSVDLGLSIYTLGLITSDRE
jgi:hypothetical protein